MLYTLGYEQRDLHEVVALLEQHGVSSVVDVRGTPRSRKPGLSKTRLAEALQQSGIGYRHEPRLGIPSEQRSAFRSGDPQTVRRYRERLAGEDREVVERVAALAREGDVALLCFERDEQRCHRAIVAELAREAVPWLDHVALP